LEFFVAPEFCSLDVALSVEVNRSQEKFQPPLRVLRMADKFSCEIAISVIPMEKADLVQPSTINLRRDF
jgi:hypothetical protein